MGLFGWLLRKFDEGVVGKNYVEAHRDLLRGIVGQVEEQEDVQFLDGLLESLASKEKNAQRTLIELSVYFAHEQYGGRLSALVQSCLALRAQRGARRCWPSQSFARSWRRSSSTRS